VTSVAAWAPSASSTSRCVLRWVETGINPKATSTLAQFLYDTDDGKLYFDADGIGTNYDFELVTTLANKASLKTSSFVFEI
jgi:hypothetical protein